MAEVKTILCANQKGGVGKSMIADEIAFSLDRDKIPYNFYDLDGQGGTIHETSEADGALVSVVDTPGALLDQTSDWIRASDVVIVPTRPTSRDIPPLMRMIEMVNNSRKPGSEVFYVVNCMNRFRACDDFIDWVTEAIGIHCQFALIPQSEAFVQAAAAGVSVLTLERKFPAVCAVRDLCHNVRIAAGLPGRGGIG